MKNPLFKKSFQSLVVLLFVLAFSVGQVSAQNVNWTPPTGAPLGNNVPPPVNVGPSGQTKTGSLYVEGNLGVGNEDNGTYSGTFTSANDAYFMGTNIFTARNGQTPADGGNFLISFLTSVFYNDVLIGDSSGAYPASLSVEGQLKYNQRDDNGNVINPLTPEEVADGGYENVLIGDGQGNVRWTEATNVGGGGTGINLPDGINPGDILIWNGTDWVPGPLSTDPGNLPLGTFSGQTLRWDGTNWVITNAVNVDTIGGLERVKIQPGFETRIGSPTVNVGVSTVTNDVSIRSDDVLRIQSAGVAANTIPVAQDASGLINWLTGGDFLSAAIPGTQGQTMWYNDGVWVATDRIKYIEQPFPVGTHTLQIGDLASLGDVVIEDTSVSVRGNPVGINTGVNYQDSLTTIDGATLEVDTVNTNIKSENTFFSNPTSNPLAGRFLFSKDDSGKVEWNKNLTYERVPFVFPGSFYDLISVVNDPDSIGDPSYIGTFFSNDGATYLRGNTAIDGETKINNKLTVSNGGDIDLDYPGDLYLEGVDHPSAMLYSQSIDSQGNPINGIYINDLDRLKPLCVDPDTFKVIYCEPAGAKPVEYVEVDILCTPDSCDNGVTLPHTFEYDANVDIEYCAGGGGGGGGGAGYDDGQDGEFGKGGGGGGGGGAATCQTYTNIDIAAGDVIDAFIGEGGNGGAAGYLKVFHQHDQNDEYDEHNLPGDDDEIVYAYNADPGNFGQDTSVYLTNWTFEDAEGGLPGAPGTRAFGNGIGNPLGGEGGNQGIVGAWHDGGIGIYGVASLDDFSQGSGPEGGDGGHGESIAGANATNLSGSRGGIGGYGDTIPTSAQGGKQGKPSYGGGGGGGAFGDYLEWDNNCPDEMGHEGSCWLTPAGEGGKGGDGYLKISRVTVPVGEPVGSVVFDEAGTWPFDWANVPAEVDAVTVRVWGGGGGGGWAYSSSDNFNSPAKAGGGGAGGYVEHVYNNPPSSGTVIVSVGVGGLAGDSTLPFTGGSGTQSTFQGLVAGGGGGGGGTTAGAASGIPGSPGSATGGATNVQGPAGQNGTFGGLGGDQPNGSSNVSDGGRGHINNPQGQGADTMPLAGKNGRVEISW